MMRNPLLCGVLLTLAMCGSGTARGADNNNAPLTKATNLVIGKLLEWCVQAGMTPDQVITVFGWPEGRGAFTSGPITNPPTDHTTVTFWYLRYGVTVNFYNPLMPSPNKMNRVDGGMQ
jgi:hypothetical protein